MANPFEMELEQQLKAANTSMPPPVITPQTLPLPVDAINLSPQASKRLSRRPDAISYALPAANPMQFTDNQGNCVQISESAQHHSSSANIVWETHNKT